MDETPKRVMEIRFTHRDESWLLDLYDIDCDESIALQRLTGRTWGDLCTSMDLADAEAIKAFWWVARRRAGDEIAYSDPRMRFKWRDFTSEILRPAADQPAVIEHQAEPIPS